MEKNIYKVYTKLENRYPVLMLNGVSFHNYISWEKLIKVVACDLVPKFRIVTIIKLHKMSCIFI